MFTNTKTPSMHSLANSFKEVADVHTSLLHISVDEDDNRYGSFTYKPASDFSVEVCETGPQEIVYEAYSIPKKTLAELAERGYFRKAGKVTAEDVMRRAIEYHRNLSHTDHKGIFDDSEFVSLKNLKPALSNTSIPASASMPIMAPQIPSRYNDNLATNFLQKNEVTLFQSRESLIM